MSVSPTGLLCFVSSFLIDGYGQNYTDRHRRWFLAVIIFLYWFGRDPELPKAGKVSAGQPSALLTLHHDDDGDVLMMTMTI